MRPLCTDPGSPFRCGITDPFPAGIVPGSPASEGRMTAAGEVRPAERLAARRRCRRLPSTRESEGTVTPQGRGAKGGRAGAPSPPAPDQEGCGPMIARSRWV